MQLHPYLSFEGRCQEAIDFYQQALDAELLLVMRAKELPPEAYQVEETGCMAGATPSPEAIVHAQLRIGDSEILLSDGMSTGHASFQGITLALTASDDAHAQRLFAALTGDGGSVLAPLMTTFFASSFGLCHDKFGVGWMVMAPAPNA